MPADNQMTQSKYLTVGHPWRISANELSEGLSRYGVVGYYVQVLLDGNVISHVITADEECGLVVVQKYTADGEPEIVGDHFVEEILYGKVNIIALPGPDGSWPHLIERESA